MAYRILSVDDSAFALLKLKGVFEQAGFEVLPSASTIDEAIERIGAIRPDLVTLDIVIVGTDGVEGVRQILRRFPDTKILMVSAMGQEGLIEQAIRNGARGFVVKPYKDETLLAEVRRILGAPEE